MKSPISRQSLLRQAFCDLPQSIGDYALRPLSGASYELLAETNNPLVAPEPGKNDLTHVLAAVSEYIWIHSANIDDVVAVENRAGLPREEIKKIGFGLPFGEALHFTSIFMESALRMAAAMSEIDDDDSTPGKPQTLPIGSHHSSSPADAPEIPSGNVISFGSHPSREPSPTSTPPTSSQEDDADGCIPLMTLPVLPTTSSEPPSDPSAIDTPAQ